MSKGWLMTTTTTKRSESLLSGRRLLQIENRSSYSTILALKTKKKAENKSAENPQGALDTDNRNNNLRITAQVSDNCNHAGQAGIREDVS